MWVPEIYKKNQSSKFIVVNKIILKILNTEELYFLTNIQKVCSLGFLRN